MSEWRDPNPAPVLEQYDGIWVVRDDLLGVGSKVRFIDNMIKNLPEKEIVFGSCPSVGYAQISLPYVAKKYGKEVHLFMAKRNIANLHEFQKKGLELGANYHWVENGMLPVTQKRARDYVAEDPKNRYLFPIGLEHPSVIESIKSVCHNLPIIPDIVWSVGSSGTLSRGLQAAWPSAEVYVVQVGHNMKQHEIGRAVKMISPYSFNQKVKPEQMPPFPSNPWYDAKGWWPMQTFLENFPEKDKTILYWNVA